MIQFIEWQFYPKFRRPWMNKVYDNEYNLMYYYFGIGYWQWRFVESRR